MVWQLQDINNQIEAEKIAAPQLLAGIDLDSEDEALKKRAAGRRLYQPNSAEAEVGLTIGSKLDLHKSLMSQKLYREREVDNLQSLIYGAPGKDNESPELFNDDALMKYDTNRYDVSINKLAMFKSKQVQIKLKKRFVTGQSADQIVKNLLNMSDSEDEGGNH